MANIKDFGEKIGGAKKDLYGLTRELQLGDIVDWSEYDREKHITKKTTFPLPDYKKLYDEGMSREVLYYIKLVRDALPTKPQVVIPFNCPETEKSRLIRAAQESYISDMGNLYEEVMQLNTVEDCISFSETVKQKKVLSDRRSDNKLKRTLWGISSYSLKRAVKRKQFLYSDDEKILSEYTIMQYDGTNVYQDTKDDCLVITNSFGKFFSYRNKEEVTNLSNWEKNTFFVMDKRNNIVFINEKDLENAKLRILEIYRNQHLEKQSGTRKRKQKLVPPQLKHIRPTSEDYRNGIDITGEEMLRIYNFRGGEFGNWESDNDRQANLNMSYDALRDLAKALGILEEDISLGGRLAIAYGARGSAGAVAHFEAGSNVINLTKMRGAGSLAHEWGHALDYYIATKNGNAIGFATEHPTGKLRDVMSVIKYNNGVKTQYYENALELDKVYTKSGHQSYWASDVEMFARAFASYINDRLSPAPSDYLVGHAEMMETISVNEDIKNVYVSPQGKERQQINKAMDELIKDLKQKEWLHQKVVEEPVRLKEESIMENDEQKLLEKIIQGYKQLLAFYPNLNNKWIDSNADRMRKNLIDMKNQLTNNPDMVVALLPQFSEEGNPNCYDNTELWNVGWNYLEQYGLSGDEKMPPAYLEIINRKETKELVLSVMQNIIDYSGNRLFYTSYMKNGVIVNEDIMLHYLYNYGANVQAKLDREGYVKSPSTEDFTYAAIAEHMGNENVVRFYTTNLLNDDRREYILNGDMEASYKAALKQYIKGEMLISSIGFSVDGKKDIELVQRNEDTTIVRSLRKTDAEKIGDIVNHAKSIPAIADMYEKLNTYYSFFLNCVRDDIDTVSDMNYTIQFELSNSKDKIDLNCRVEEDKVLLSIEYMDENDSIKNDYKISVLKHDFIDKQNTEWFNQTYNTEEIKDGLYEMSYEFASRLSAEEHLKLLMSENFKSLIDMFKEIDDLEIEVLSNQHKKAEEHKEKTFAEQVDEVLAGTFPFYSALKVCDTPDIMLKIGCQQLPILYTQRHLKNALQPLDDKEHKHGLKIEQIKSLPDLLENPIMIMDSLSRDDSIIIVTEENDLNNNPILISIRPNGMGRYELQEIDSNFITSVYGRNRFDKFLRSAIEEEKILYCNKTKSQTLFERWGEQYSELTNNLDFDKIIHQSKNIVNANLTIDAEEQNIEKNSVLEEVAMTEENSEDIDEFSEFAAEHKKKIGTMDVNRMPVVINAFGGPGSGKSVSCMDICQQLKKLGYNAEYVQEYAKELVYAEDWTKLDGQPDHQFDVLKEQLSRVDRLYGKVDFIVTDSPVLLNRVYNKNLTPEYDQMVTDLFNDFSNFCYFVERDATQYQQEGRIQNLEESQQIDGSIKNLLDEKSIYYGTYNHQTIDKIVKNSIDTFNRINKIQVPATEKQISYAMKIAEVLNIPLPEQNTKIAYSDFINQNQQNFYKEMAATKNQESMDTSENYLDMVKENANRLAEVPEDFYTEEILLAAVNSRGAIIRIIPNQYLTQTIVAAAVKQYGLALKYVPEQMRTKDICIEAYNSSGGKSIRYTPEDIKEVVRQQGEEIIKSQNSIMPPNRMELDDRLIARIDAQMQEHEQNSELMMKDVELAARYSKYSLRNIRILLEQNPDIFYVASAEQFQKMGYEITDNQPLSIRVPVYAKYIYENGQKIYSNQYSRQIRQAIKDGKLQEKKYLKGFSFVASVFDITQTNCRPDNYPGIYDGVQIEPEFYGEVFEALSQFVNESLDYKVVLEDAKHINLYGSIDKSGKIIRIQNDLDVVKELEQLCSCIAEIIVNSSDERNVKTEKQKLCESDMLTIMLESSIGFNNFDADQLYEHFNQYREEEANKEHPYEVKLEKTVDRVQSKLFNAYLGGIVHNLQLHLPKQQHQKDIQMQNVVKNLANIDVATNADNYDTIKDNTNVFPEKTNIYQETAEKIKLGNSFVPKLGIIQQDVLGDRNNYELLDVQFLDEKFVRLLEQYPDQIRREYLPLDMPVGVIIGVKKNVMDKPQYYRVTEDELVILTDEQARIINESLPETKIDTGLTMKKEYRALEMLYKSEIEFTEELRKRFKYLQGYFDSENYLSNRLHSTAEFMARLNLLIEDLAPNHRELVKEYVFRTGNIERAYEYGDKLSRNLSAIPKMLWELRTVDSYKYMLWTIEQYERACNVSPEYCLTTGEYNTASMPVLTSNVNSLSDIQKAYKDIMIYSASETFQNYGVIQDDNNYYRIVGISLQDYKPCICLSEQKFDTLKSAINYYAENIRTENNYLRNIKSTDELLKFNQSDNATIQDINIDKMSVEDETIIFNDLKSSSVFGDKYAYLDVEPQENSNLYLSDRMGTIWKNVIQDKNDINMFEKMNLSQYHFCTNMEDFKALAKNQAIHEWKSGITNNEVYVYVVDSNLEQLPKEQYMSVYDFKKSIDTLRSAGNKDNVDITYKVITKTDTYLNRIQNDLEDVYVSVYNKAKDVKPELSRQIAKQYYQDQIDFNDTLLKPVMNSIKSQENDEQLMESAAILMNANELLDDELKKLDVAPADAEILKLQAGSINENTVRNIEQQMQQHIQQRQQVQRKQEVSIGD